MHLPSKRKFKEDIQRTLFVHALVPVLIITLVLVGIISILWIQSISKQNKQSLQMLSSELESILPDYLTESTRIAQSYDWNRIQTDKDYSAAFSEDLYRFLNNQRMRANFAAFGSEHEVIYFTNRRTPEFVRDIPGISWGIFNRMREIPDQAVMDVYAYPTSEGKSVELQIGQAIVRQGKITGYVVFTFAKSDFLHLISSQPVQMMITDRHDRVFVTTDYNFYDPFEKMNAELREASGYTSYNKHHYYIRKTEAGGGSLQIYAITDTGDMLATLTGMGILIVVVLATLIFAMFFSAKSVSVRKTKSIDEIVSAFNSVQNGDFNTYLNTFSNDEFRIIGRAYNHMLDSIKDLIRKNNVQVRERTLLEIRQLESQFNPHFLYNSLENVRFMVRMDPQAADKMIVSLSHLLRYSIQNRNDAVTLREELNYTLSYLTILTYRFGDRFKYELHIAEEAENSIVPRLIFQPLIENAVKYGFGDRQKLTVLISVSFQEEDLIVLISDDGEGIEPELLQEINRNLSSTSNKTDRLGLYNVSRRITLMYGEGYRLEVKSERDAGTTIRLRLPISRNVPQLLLEKESGDSR